jgi:ribonuclease BN (tRNA processing enzyme)
MKPTSYRGASAIFFMMKNQGILMDSAEGSYGQLLDHFGGDKEKVSDILLKTRCVFITHIHGDHQLGVLKIMYERDLLHSHNKNPNNKLYVVTPTPMMEWMKLFVSDSLDHPEMVVLVPSKNLNPETQYYYQKYEENSYRDVKASEILDTEDQRPLS